MASNATKARPYRKASEYLVQARRRPESLEPKSPLEIENEELRQKVHALTRKCEHGEVEYMQSREYMENQLDQVQDKYDILNRNYSKLKTQFEALTNAARQLSEKNTKISRLESEKLSLVKDIDELTQRVSESKNSYLKLQQENERLRKDCNLAVQLLRCNKSNYQVQKREELPVDLRKRVDETSVSMEGYNEYINPYADSDEGAVDDDVTSYIRDNNLDAGISNSTSTNAAGPGEVSVDVLANVLEKAENVHMNLEESDYITDHQLNSSYTARFLDRKLIKVDNGDLERSKLPPPPVSTAPQPQESSPWELQTPSTLNRPTTTKYTDPDHMDESAAAAYGVYSLPLKRRNREHMTSQHMTSQHTPQPLPPPPQQPTTTQPPTTSLSSPSLLAYTSSPPPHNSDVIEERASSPDDFQFRQPLNSSANKSVSKVTDVTATTNQKSPRHQARKEKASNDEKASLLLVDESDSDDIIGDSTMKLEEKLVLEEHLEVEDEEEVKDGIDLEWDSTLHHHHPPPLDDYHEDHVDPAVEEDVKDDLLLSYHDVTVVDNVSSSPQVAISLDDIFGPDDAEADRLKELLASPTEHHTTDESGGNGGSSLLESLIESPPPPPMEFAADETDTTEVDRDSDELRSSSTRRRNTSMERAQEFGNVLD